MAAKTNNEKIILLINKQINEDLSEAEQQELEAWLDNPSNKALYTKLTNKEWLLKKRFEYDEYNVSHAWQKVNKRISPQLNFKRWLSYAAAIVLPLVMFYAVYQLSNKPGVDKTLVSETIHPGERKAILVLSDGQQVELSAADTSLQMNATHIVIDSLGAYYQGKNQTANTTQQYNTLKTARGMEYSLQLADGTKVWLNAESSLRYPESFNGDTREVYASGEVYLEVAKDAQKPFFVHFNNKRIKVLGTAFNVRAYENEKTDVVTLLEGSVALTTPGNSVKMKPNEQAISGADNTIQVNQVNASLYTAWKDGSFVYRDVPLNQIVRDLARWYDVDVFYQNQSMKTERFSINTNRQENIQDILEALELTQTVKFKVNGKNIVIQSVN